MTSHADVLDALAAEVGLDVGQFHKHLADGSAEKAFKEDLRLTRAYGVTGFPTCLVSYGDKQIMLRGYNDYGTFVRVIDMVSGGKVRPVEAPLRDDETILDFIRAHGRVALAELAAAFDFPDIESADRLVGKMRYDNRVIVKPVGEGYFVEPAEIKEIVGGHYCDAASGQCI